MQIQTKWVNEANKIFQEAYLAEKFSKELKAQAAHIEDTRQKQLFINRRRSHLKRLGIAVPVRKYRRKSEVLAMKPIRDFLAARKEAFERINHPDHLKEFSTHELRGIHLRFTLCAKAIEDEYIRRVGHSLIPLPQRKTKDDQ